MPGAVIHSQREKSIKSLLWLERKTDGWWKRTGWLTSNSAQMTPIGKEVWTTSSSHKNLQCNQIYNLPLNAAPIPMYNAAIMTNYATNYSLWNVQYIALKKLKSSEVKKKKIKWMHNPQLVHAARPSPMFSVWPVSNSRDGEWLMVQSTGLSSSNAASLSSWWSSTFSVAPQADIPDWTDSAQPCEFSPPGALALSDSRWLAWRIQAGR